MRRVVGWVLAWGLVCGAVGASGMERVDADGVALPEGAVARFGTTRLRHPRLTSDADHFAFSFDGARVATWTDELLRVWNVADGRLQMQASSPTKLSAVGWSRDGRTIVVARTDAGMERYDASTGRSLGRIGEGTYHRVAVAPRGDWLAAARAVPTESIEVLRSTDGAKTAELFVGKTRVTALAVSRDGASLTAVLRRDGGRDRGRIVARWKTVDWSRAPDLEIPNLPSDESLSEDGARFAASSRARRETIVWDVAGRLVSTRIPRALHSLRFAGDDLLVATEAPSGGGAHQRVVTIDAASGEEQSETMISRWVGDQARVTADGQVVATVLRWRGLVLWDVESGERRFLDAGHDGYVGSLHFAADGRTLLSTGDELRVWDVETQRQRCVAWDADAPLTMVADDTQVVAASRGGVRRFDLKSGLALGPVLSLGRTDRELLLEYLRPGERGGTVVALERHLGVGPEERRNRRTEWKLETGELVSESESRWGESPVHVDRYGHEGLRPLHAKRAAPAADAPVAGRGGWRTTLDRFDLRTGKLIDQRELADDAYVLHLAWSADHATLAGSVQEPSAGTSAAEARRPAEIRVWSWPKGGRLATIPLAEPQSTEPACLALSTDGRILLAARGGGWIEAYDARTGRQLRRYGAYESRCVKIAVAPDGRRFASGYADGTILLWDSP